MIVKELCDGQSKFREDLYEGLYRMCNPNPEIVMREVVGAGFWNIMRKRIENRFFAQQFSGDSRSLQQVVISGRG